MKQTKKLTYEQKKKLSKKGFNSEEYRYLGEYVGAWEFLHTRTGEKIFIKK